ncbi:MAG: hypothetical protein JSS63_09890 [Bacteroidetes bacterium]|nr:hypothetical protein [Bacteroidota bacterium]
MKKPPIELQRKYKTEYKDKSIFASNARLLQSIWREENNIQLERTYGNFLSSEQAYTQELNFLTPKIKEIVKKEIEENVTRKGKDVKVMKKDRLYENLLSSQPLAFNLFGELVMPDYELAHRVFKKLFPDKIKKVTSINFEISTCRGDLNYTGDHSAFDVFITYDGIKGKGFIGIEVKYAETLLDIPARFKERYKEVAIQSGKFTEEGINELCKMPKSLEQIWRDHLLSLSMIPPVNIDYDEGFFVFLYPKKNQECVNALTRYRNYLNSTSSEETGIHQITMEDFVAAIKSETSEQWVIDFEDRYLNFEKIEAPSKKLPIF